MAANLITLLRVLLALLSIFLISTSSNYYQWGGALLIPVVMLLDMLDGYVARQRGTVNPYGSLYDILGDRIVSFSYFVFFVSVRVCPFWVAVTIIIRGLMIDMVRTIAFERGLTAFSDNVLNIKYFIVWLSKSRFSRAFYNSLKTLLFFAMAVQFIHGSVAPDFLFVMTLLTVVWSLIRAIPVFIIANKLIYQNR